MLVTNDYPPKLGGIQSYLWELWRRIPSQVVVSASHPEAERFDAAQPNEVIRLPERVLLPTPAVLRRVRQIAAARNELTFLDPVLPLGLIGPKLQVPYACIVHGSELTVPARIMRALPRYVLERAELALCAGKYPAQIVNQITQNIPVVVIPPGVDTKVFHPIDDAQREATRVRFGLDPSRPLIVSVSRLVPRKGFDILIDALAEIDDSVVCAIAGAGRDRRRLEERAKRRGVHTRVHFLGSVSAADLPSLYASADVFAMLCRDRWAGLEAEGFGIVFLEAGACGVPLLAGHSGGSSEAVEDGVTGFVVEPRRVSEVAARLTQLFSDDELRVQMGKSARERAVRYFNYDELVSKLAPFVAGDLNGAT